MTVETYDARICSLGEGPLWHPTRKAFFWFDILEKKLLSQNDGRPASWTFDAPVSAAGWLDDGNLLVASATGLYRFSIADGTRTLIANLEHNNTKTRSNDGRADPWGGFWIGTMGYNAETGAGAIYRYFQGQLRKLVSDITISNAICFAPDRSHAYFTDTPTGHVMKIALDRNGWPVGNAKVFIDLSAEGLKPDGAVTDANGKLWIAQWGAARVACYDKDGIFQNAVALPAHQVTCPAFGGEDYSTLLVTSAAAGLPDDVLAAAPKQGMTFAIPNAGKGLPEPRVLL